MLGITLKHMEYALILERFLLTLTQAETASLLGNLILEYTNEANKLQRMHPPEPAMVFPSTGAKSTFPPVIIYGQLHVVLSGACLLDSVPEDKVVNCAYKEIYE